MVDALGSEKMFGFLKTAMNAASLRHQVASSNLANVDTPGYKARELDFEAVMQDYVDQEAMQPVTRGDVRNPLPPPQPLNFKDYITVKDTGYLVDQFDGNNVELENEMADMAHARGRFKLASQFMTRKIRLLNEIMASR
ncbi:MAG: flagellar basal body rod protein FlgB [Acidobacteriota bacterium]|nr:flagellar basal body rod protein FlgB [Acidobacteriota bacterium]